jgi:hypothetical protein
MSVKSKQKKYRPHAATGKFAQRRAVHTDPYWTGAWQSVTPCPDQKKDRGIDDEDGIEEHTANQKECAAEGAGRNRSVCPGIILYTKRQVRQSRMPVCQG